jgi:hypothetical protein
LSVIFICAACEDVSGEMLPGSVFSVIETKRHCRKVQPHDPERAQANESLHDPEGARCTTRAARGCESFFVKNDNFTHGLYFVDCWHVDLERKGGSAKGGYLESSAEFFRVRDRLVDSFI